jgi:hypothetical protein
MKTLLIKQTIPIGLEELRQAAFGPGRKKDIDLDDWSDESLARRLIQTVGTSTIQELKAKELSELVRIWLISKPPYKGTKRDKAIGELRSRMRSDSCRKKVVRLVKEGTMDGGDR